MSVAFLRPPTLGYPTANDDQETMGDDSAEQQTRRLSESEQGTEFEGILAPERRGLKRFWDRINGKERKKVGVLESLKNFIFSSCEYVSEVSSTDAHVDSIAG